MTFGAKFDVDYAAFRGDENVDIVEVYLLMPRILFKFVEEDNQFHSNILVRVAFAKNDTIIDWKQWTLVDNLADTSMDIRNQQIPEQVIFQLAPDTYKLIVIVADQNRDQKFKHEEDVIITKYSDNLEISDIQLASRFNKTTTKNKFSKYFGYDFIPHANLIFGEKVPEFFAFCEIYNLSYTEGVKEKYKVRYTVSDLNDNVIKQFPWMEKNKPGASAVEIKKINLADVESGLFNFKVEIEDIGNGKLVSKTKRFYIVKKGEQKKLNDLMTINMLAEKNEKELEELFGPMSYIATNIEKRQFKRSDIEGKRQLILNFWYSRDPNPDTPINEAQQKFEYHKNYANQNFGGMNKEGWETDKGRILIIYGPPSDIERNPSSLEAKPHEIWYYHELEGGAEFVFIDKSGFGYMELVHSTARNELTDYDWRRFITQGLNY